MQLVLRFSAWFLSHTTVFIFNRKTYITANLAVIGTMVALHGWKGLAGYFVIGLAVAPVLAFLDFDRQRNKFEDDFDSEFRWYHYAPFFVLDVIGWVYAAMGLTGDVIYGHLSE